MRGVRGPCGPGNGREDGIQPAFRLSVLMGQGTLLSLANGCRHGVRFTWAQAIPLINLGRGNIIPGCRNRPPPPPPRFVSPVLCGPGFGWCVLCLVRLCAGAGPAPWFCLPALGRRRPCAVLRRPPPSAASHRRGALLLAPVRGPPDGVILAYALRGVKPVCDPVRVAQTRPNEWPVSDLAEVRPGPLRLRRPLDKTLLIILYNGPRGHYRAPKGYKIMVLSNGAPAPRPFVFGFGVRAGGFRRGSGAGAVLAVCPVWVVCGACRSLPASAPARLVCLGGSPAFAPVPLARWRRLGSFCAPLPWLRRAFSPACFCVPSRGPFHG